MENSNPDSESEKKDRKWLLILLLLLLLLIFGLFFYRARLRAPKEVNAPQLSGEEAAEDGGKSDLSPEDVLKSLEQDDSLGSNVELSITSPEEETFMPGQARLWQGEFANIETDDSFRADCHWKFYLNQNNEEVLYKEMENASGVSKQNPEVCKFTSTFIESRGVLRAELNVEIKSNSGETIEGYQAERKYTVQ